MENLAAAGLFWGQGVFTKNKILVIIDIMALGFYEYILNIVGYFYKSIDRYFYKNIGKVKITLN